MTVHTGNESAPTPDEAAHPAPDTTGPDTAAAEPPSSAEKVSGKKAGDKKAAGTRHDWPAASPNCATRRSSASTSPAA